MKTILVFGGTGKTGRHVISHALSEGFKVKSFSCFLIMSDV